jgi:hypothetical protein
MDGGIGLGSVALAAFAQVCVGECISKFAAADSISCKLAHLLSAAANCTRAA